MVAVYQGDFVVVYPLVGEVVAVIGRQNGGVVVGITGRPDERCADHAVGLNVSCKYVR